MGCGLRAYVYVCTCLLCVCTNDIDVQVCVIVRNRNSVRGRALRSKGGSNKIDTSALDSPLPVPLLFFPLSFITCLFFLPFSYFLHSPSNDYEPRENPCWKKKLTRPCHSSIKISFSVLITLVSLSLLLSPSLLEFPSPASFLLTAIIFVKLRKTKRHWPSFAKLVDKFVLWLDSR